ncbi:hypothetical protein [Tistrella mobilis]|uniref:Uncharacterized protein n=1 Tax=Tistrella mobilis (strain KA081020-065) TaxID=1110502 RepID=I3TVT4_TISMK|nr:hypothetical protein [Tistrella mobilis]AFK56872.1 hypothetical protein TMO_c0262 [Tistrella mobilis KA081020-065]
MKVQILDTEALRAISPQALAAYVRSEGWSRAAAYGLHGDVYTAPGRPDIILPRSEHLADYAGHMTRLIRIFSEMTGYDDLTTYRELSEADRDVIRIRSVGLSEDGTLPLDRGVRMIEKARDLVLAAACATRSPQALYRAGANREAADYIKRVKLGQTEHGSYVLTLLAPVPPRLTPPQPLLDETWDTPEEEPVERQVTQRLMAALIASRSAVERSTRGDAEAFEQAIGDGVSANLCEALAGLIDQSERLDIRLTWARTRPVPEIHRDVSFSKTDAGVLSEAARIFRLRAPVPDVTLHATVHQLKRDQDDIDGVVTLKAVIEDALRSVTVVLDPANYRLAVRAHENQTPIVVTGDLERSGQRWRLINPKVKAVSPEK